MSNQKKTFMTYKLKQTKWWMMAVLSCLCCGVEAQQLTQVKGSVLSENSESLSGVSITVTQSGTKEKQSTSTNEKGIFVVPNLKPFTRYNFAFSYVGFQDHSITNFLVNNGENNSLLVRMKQAVSTLNDVVVVGYGTQQIRYVTGATSQVKSKDLNKYVASGFASQLAGKAPGVWNTKR